MEEEYVRLIAVAGPGESEEAFSSRLSEFWTQMLREHKERFEQVYAETIEFEEEDGRLTRQYLCEDSVAEFVAEQMRSAGVEHMPIDSDDRWTKYEAVSTEWMQIEH